MSLSEYINANLAPLNYSGTTCTKGESVDYESHRMFFILV
jgi:hypothetical protein